MKHILICCILALASASTLLEKPQKVKPTGLPGVDPKGFVNIGGQNYYISPDTYVTAIEAIKFCNDVGMTLVSLETVQESRNVLNYTVDQGLGAKAYWTSGRPLVDTWIWSGSGQLFSDLDWQNGEPVRGSEDNCVYFNGLRGWEINDCGLNARFLCE